MIGVVLCDEYYENPVFSEDEEKNLAMWHTYEREYELRQELAVLQLCPMSTFSLPLHNVR